MKVKKVKYPKSLWVAFNGLMQPCDVGKVMCKGWYFGRKRYHLHPGNEVARAQIVKDLNYLYECPSPMGTALVAKRFGVGFKGMRFV